MQLGFGINSIVNAIYKAFPVLFSLLNRTSIIPEIGTHYSSTVGAGAVLNHGGNYQDLPANCAKFKGGRYGINRLPRSESLSDWISGGSAVSESNKIITLNSEASNGTIYYAINTIITLNEYGVFTFKLKGVGSSIGKIVSLQLYDNGTRHTLNITLTSEYKIHTLDFQRLSAAANVSCGLILESGTSGSTANLTTGEQVAFDWVQFETKTAYPVAEQTIPSEYVSAGVLSDPWYGCNVDGIKCFSTELANTVDGNGVVTEAVGALLSPQPARHYEPESTNVFLNSYVPVTQNITTTAQTYTLSIDDDATGDITLTGTATGTATAGSPLTFTATAGTLTCTVNGTVNTAQIEAGSFATTIIKTLGSAVTRTADIDVKIYDNTIVDNFQESFLVNVQGYDAGVNDFIYSVGIESPDNRYMLTVNAAGKFEWEVTIGGVSKVVASDSAISLDTDYQINLNITSHIMTMEIDDAVQADTETLSGDLTISQTTAYIGSYSHTGGTRGVIGEIVDIGRKHLQPLSTGFTTGFTGGFR